MMSATSREAVGPAKMLCGGRGEVRERIVALDAVVREVADAAAAECDRPVLRRAYEQPADVRMLAERGDERGVARPRSPRASGGAARP